jgi:hypothetical protein
MDCLFTSTVFQFYCLLAGVRTLVASVVVTSHSYDQIPEAYVSFNDHPHTVSVDEAHRLMDRLRATGFQCERKQNREVCDDADHYDEPELEEELDYGWSADELKASRIA